MVVVRRIASQLGLLNATRARDLNRFRFMAFCTMTASSPSGTQQQQGPLTHYKSMVRRGTLKYDPQQERVASDLQNLLGQLYQYEKNMEEYYARLREWEMRREQLRRELLIEEAKSKQKSKQEEGLWKIIDKQEEGLWKIIDKQGDNQIMKWLKR